MTAGDIARAAIVHSTQISARLRELAGKDGDVLELRPAIARLFVDEADRAEAYRLLDLATMVRRKKVVATGYNDLFAEANE
jgi:hypothetical protein